ncbi:MAG TPA: hypothetical protein VLX09_14240 [Stellaceae bacterium]|nr:hypothetical protein [Stellaceae bacterium]
MLDVFLALNETLGDLPFRDVVTELKVQKRGQRRRAATEIGFLANDALIPQLFDRQDRSGRGGQRSIDRGQAGCNCAEEKGIEYGPKPTPRREA